MANLPSSSPPVSAVSATLMFREAAEAAVACERFLHFNRATLERIGTHLREHPPQFVVTCARGSSDHAATYGKYLIETYLGRPTASVGLSVASLYGVTPRPSGGLCLAVSQSGRSPDLLATVEAYKRAGTFVVALVNDETSPLAQLADEVLALRAGPELSVAATKSFITSLCGMAALTAAWSGDMTLNRGLERLPAALNKAFACDWSKALSDFSPGASLFVIGRGYGLAAAQEAALKLKETCALHAEAYSSAEVRHGPMAIVNSGFPILAFATGDEAGDDVRRASRAFAERGAKVWLISSQDEGRVEGILPSPAIEPVLEPIVQIQSFYRFANHLALTRGLNPDSPPHLLKVTQTT